MEAVETRHNAGSRNSANGAWAKTWRRKPPAAPTARGGISRSPALSIALPNAFFDSLGLPDTLRDQTRLTQPNRRVRTRTHGGVTGTAREGLPMSIANERRHALPTKESPSQATASRRASADRHPAAPNLTARRQADRTQNGECPEVKAEPLLRFHRSASTRRVARASVRIVQLRSPITDTFEANTYASPSFSRSLAVLKRWREVVAAHPHDGVHRAAVTFQSHFSHPPRNRLVPLAAATAVVLHVQPAEGRPRPMQFSVFGAGPDPWGIRWGGVGSSRMRKDLRLRPRLQARGKRFDLTRQRTIHLAMDLFAAVCTAEDGGMVDHLQVTEGWAGFPIDCTERGTAPSSTTVQSVGTQPEPDHAAMPQV